MKTIFLAAGKSNRVKPLGDKNLLEFSGKPLLLHLLENAKEGGLENFVIVCNTENKDSIANILQKENFPAEITIQLDLEGMAGGVLTGLELVKDEEEVFILGGNDFVNPDIYQKIIQKSKEISGGILAKKVDSYFPGGYLEVDKENIIQSIVEKPGEGNEPSNLMNIVGHYFRSAEMLKNSLKKAQSSKDDVYETVLQSLFSETKFIAVEYQDVWQAIKYPWHVLDMKNEILRAKIPGIFVADSAEVSEKATLLGENIYIDEGVKVLNNATIIGPCYIGKNTIIGQGCLVRQSNIGADCVIGFNTEVCRSFLANNVSTHSAYIGDSVVDEGVNFGAFSVTTNLRLDKENVKMKIKENLLDSGRSKLGAIVGKNTQIGSGTKILPGRKIPENSLIEPNTIWK